MDLFRFDAEYLERLTSGDPGTEQHFVSYFTELMGIKLRARRLGPDQVNEIRQETFLRVFRSIRDGKIREPQSLGSYVNSVCHHVALECNRTEFRNRVADDPEVEAEDQQAGPETELLSAEEGATVRKILGSLRPRSRRILSRLFLDECSPEEVCREFNVDANYLRVLVFRARQQFREAMNTRERVRVAGRSETHGR